LLFFKKAFSLTGRQGCVYNNPGRCPGLGVSALYLSLRPVTVGSGRAASGAFGASALYLSLPPVTVGSGRVGLTYESLVKIVNEKIYFIWKLL